MTANGRSPGVGSIWPSQTDRFISTAARRPANERQLQIRRRERLDAAPRAQHVSTWPALLRVVRHAVGCRVRGDRVMRLRSDQDRWKWELDGADARSAPRERQDTVRSEDAAAAGESIESALRVARELLSMEIAWVAEFRHGKKIFRTVDGD